MARAWPRPHSFTRPQALLLASVVVTLALYWIPYGRTAAYPLVLLSTLAHELGHGLTAWATGGRFDALQMAADGSGQATWSAPDGAAWRRGLVAAGGLIGPAVGAALGFFAARSPARCRALLAVTAGGLVLVELLWVRNPFGLLFVAGVAAALLVVLRFASARGSQLAVMFFSVQLGLAVFSRADYLFTRTAGGAGQPSDVEQIADAWFLPYWVWGLVCGAGSLVILALGLRAAWRRG